MDNYTWTYIQKYPKQTKRLLGIDYEQLKQLIEQGRLLRQKKQEEIEKKKIRLIQAEGGNHPKLSEEEQIIIYSESLGKREIADFVGRIG